MTVRRKRPTQEDVDRLQGEWWQTAMPGAPAEFVWDDEIRAVNDLLAGLDEVPAWALAVRGAMPRYGFEMCSERWLDGLDGCTRMVAEGKPIASRAGRCGDLPGRLVAAAEDRAAAVTRWLHGAPAARTIEREVGRWLGRPDARKKEAAQCFVEMVRAHFFGTAEEIHTVTAKWRAHRRSNEIIKALFEGEGLVGLLENKCGYRTVPCLDLMIRAVGGDRGPLAEASGLCNGQLRFVFRDDPVRFDTTRGYLWGWYAYGTGRSEGWLRREEPDCAGAAIYARQELARTGPPTPLRRWLVASLLKSAKIWCQCAVDRAGKDQTPKAASDLPDVREVARAG